MKKLFTPRRTRGLVLLLIFSLFLPQWGQWALLPTSAAITQEEIDALQDEADGLAAQLKDLESQMSSLSSDKSAAIAQKSNLEQQINVYQAELDNIAQQVAQYAILIEEKEADVASAEADEAAQYELFCQRVRVMEESGETSYWSILFAASSFSDLLDRFNMIEEIMAYDNGVMDQLILMRENLQLEQEELETAKVEQEAVYAQQLEAQNALVAKEAEVDAIIQTIASQQSLLNEAEDALTAAAAAMDAEIAAAEEELRQWLASQNNSIVSEAGFIWPLATSYNTLSSLFGSRIHPITGLANNHSGIDIPAPSGTNIYAAKSGVVSISAYNSSYGNYCVITHADGESSLYAHMKTLPIVGVGDTVTQGQVIGYVGTTGSSTGNHLHFEIRQDSVRQDPIDYYDGFTLYVQSGGVSVLLSH